MIQECGGFGEQEVEHGKEIGPAPLEVSTKHPLDLHRGDPRQVTLTLRFHMLIAEVNTDRCGEGDEAALEEVSWTDPFAIEEQAKLFGIPSNEEAVMSHRSFNLQLLLYIDFNFLICAQVECGREFNDVAEGNDVQ